jgi:hypothetical protein
MDRHAPAVLTALLLAGLTGAAGLAGCAGAPPEAAPSAPTSAPTPAAGMEPPAGAAPAADVGPVLDAATLATGGPPRVAYAYAEHPTFGGGDWELVTRDGGRHAFTDTPALFAAYDDVVVNGFGTEGGFVVELFGGDARPQHEQRGLCSFALVTAPDRQVVAWLQNDGSLVEQDADGSLSTRPLRLPGGPCGDVEPVALRGATVFVDGPRTPPSALRGPGRARPISALRDLADVSARGNLVGRLPGTQPGTQPCWGMLRQGREQRWRTCADRLVSFSPDGRRVLGTRGAVDGGHVRGIVVHGLRTGGVESQWGLSRSERVTQVEWEDEAHLLAVVHDRAVGWSVVRLGVEGSAEYAVAPVRSGGEFAPFRLQLS